MKFFRVIKKGAWSGFIEAATEIGVSFSFASIKPGHLFFITLKKRTSFYFRFVHVVLLQCSARRSLWVLQRRGNDEGPMGAQARLSLQP